MRKFSLYVPLLAIATLALALESCVSVPSSPPRPQQVLLAPDEIRWVDGPPVLPGAKMAVIEGEPKTPGPFTMRIKAPANSKLPPHWHPAIEHVTVIAGTFHVGMGEQFEPAQAKALPVGSFMVMPPKVPHFVFFKEETVIQVHGIGPWELHFVNPADDPRKK